MQKDEIGFTDFIASTIHDMKNSLNMQINALEGIARQCQDKGDHDTFGRLIQINYEANRMNGNLIQLLSLYKMGESIYPMDISEHFVREVIDEAIMQDEAMMKFRGIEIEVECEGDCYWYFDRDLISGVLINALNNAYKYTRDKIRIIAQIRDADLEIRVEDNGQGYPAAMLNGAAGTGRATNFNSGSTGLGFYFSSRVAKMHKNGERQGSLTIENGGHYGGGCFVVRLP